MNKSRDNAPQNKLVFRALIILMAGVFAAGCSQDDSSGQDSESQQAATPVETQTLEAQDIDVYSEYPARIKGKETARIIGRVTGILEKKDYTEGSIVHKGDLLFQIDPRPYRATVNQRKGQLAKARASLQDSTRVWERTRRLYDKDAVSESERDKALADYQGDKAAVQEAEANLEAAQIDLDYTTVEAPITGVTSMRDMDLGSLINANDTQLTTITQLDPVYVMFALPEDDAFARRQVLSQMGEEKSDDTTRQVSIMLKDGEKFPHKAEVDFTQSTIDPETGTVRLRAILNNPDNELMPGRYVRARLRIRTLEDAVAVPEKAISTGQRTEVFVVRDGKAKAVGVELGPNTEEGQVIDEGLKPGDEVIVGGTSGLNGGDPVKVENDGDDDQDDAETAESDESDTDDHSSSEQNS